MTHVALITGIAGLGISTATGLQHTDPPLDRSLRSPMYSDMDVATQPKSRTPSMGTRAQLLRLTQASLPLRKNSHSLASASSANSSSEVWYPYSFSSIW